MQNRSTKLLIFLVAATFAIPAVQGSMSLALAQDRGSAQAFEALSETQRREFISLIELGLSAYDRGDFNRALRHFTDAYDIFEHPDVLYRIALTQERLGNDAEALQAYRSFLEQVPDADERGRIENTMRVIEGRLAALASRIRILTEPAGAQVYINDVAAEPVGATPLELPIEADQYTVFVRHKGYKSVEEVIEVPRGQTVVLRYALAPLEAGEAAKPSFAPAIVSGTLTLGAAALSAMYFVQMADHQRERQWLLDRYARSERGDEVNVLEEQIRTKKLRGGVSAGVAGIGLGATIYFVTRAMYAPTASLPPSTGWTVGMAEGGLQLRWSTDF
jgi:tetratricopeptide (TPR) repeat protein